MCWSRACRYTRSMTMLAMMTRRIHLQTVMRMRMIHLPIMTRTTLLQEATAEDDSGDGDGVFYLAGGRRVEAAVLKETFTFLDSVGVITSLTRLQVYRCMTS